MFSKSLQFPELSGLEATERKRLLKACRWKMFRHWQAWVTAIPVGLALLLLLSVAGLWYLNLTWRVFSQLPLLILALLALVFFFATIHLKRKVFSYFLAPHMVKALSDNDLAAVLTEHGRLQQLRKKSIRKGIGFSALILLSVVASGAVAVNSLSGSPSPLPMPEELQAAGVVTNPDGVTKATFIDIAFRDSPGGKTREIILAGTQGALIVGPDRSSRFVHFEDRQDHVDHIRLDRQGTSGFMNRGAWCSDALVMDESGHILWRCSAREIGIDDMASGDVNGDGNPEYAVGFNGGGGVRLLDTNGRQLWGEPDANVWHVEFVDVDGDGHQEIVHSNAGGEITVRDSRGRIVSKSRPPCYFSEFSLILWPDASSPERLLQAHNDTIWILDAAATPLARFSAPASGSLGGARGTLVAFQGGTSVLATAIDFSNWDRSILYLHDLSGKLLYQEVLPESCRSLAVMPAEGSKVESLLVGCAGKVFEYRM
jgi:hypothetical protein